MPTLEQGITALLNSDAALVGLVSGGFYSENLPPDYPVPCVLFTGVGDGVLDMALDGSLTGVVDVRIQFDIYADLHDQVTVMAIRKQLVKVLNIPNTQVNTPDGVFEFLMINPQGYGQYLPEPATRHLRYQLDFLAQFGDS